MNVTGEDIMVFAHDFNGRTSYSLGVRSKKLVNGQRTDDYIKAYMYAQFPRNNAPRDKTKIDINKAFVGAYENRDGDTGSKVIVQEWKYHKDGSYNSRGNYNSGYNDEWGM